MDAKTLKGIAVVAIQDGQKVGSVSQVRFNIDRRRIQGFEVGTGGLFGGNTLYLPMDNVASLGPDAIMIRDRDALSGDSASDQVQQFPTLDDLTSLRVISQGGALLGTLARVDIDPQTGAMSAIEIEKPGITGAFKAHIDVPIDQVISLGRDVAVVPDSVTEQPAVEEPVGPGEEAERYDQPAS
ncbi:MAG TPA: PRC-barrel domain-containing protein [Thermomicrobiaceae bacterium]|nr:PRC-barrel domain-containing protein [Thermomicrobiaceae bacterium]